MLRHTTSEGTLDDAVLPAPSLRAEPWPVALIVLDGALVTRGQAPGRDLRAGDVRTFATWDHALRRTLSRHTDALVVAWRSSGRAARGEPAVTSGRLSPIDLARARAFAAALSDARSDPGSAAGELLAMLSSSGLPVRPVAREAWATSPLDARIADALSATVFTPGTLATAKVLAAQLGMDEKPTLRAINDYLRRLHLTVRSWQAYATRIRVDLGLFAMSAPGARTEEIARLLGFSSPTAFCHAFTRAGLPSPGAIRDILRRDLAA